MKNLVKKLGSWFNREKQNFNKAFRVEREAFFVMFNASFIA